MYYTDHYYGNQTERMWCLIRESLEASTENQIYTSPQALRGPPKDTDTINQNIPLDTALA